MSITYVQLRSFETDIKLCTGSYLIHNVRETYDGESFCNGLSSEAGARSILYKKLFLNNFHRKTHVMEYRSNKDAGLKACNSIKRDSNEVVFL